MSSNPKSSEALRAMIREARKKKRASSSENVPAVDIRVAPRRKPAARPALPIPPADSYITIVCQDEHRLVVPKHIAKRCGCMFTLLKSTSSFVETVTNTIHFPDISGPMMEKVVSFLFQDYLTNGSNCSILGENNVQDFLASRLVAPDTPGKPSTPSSGDDDDDDDDENNDENHSEFSSANIPTPLPRGVARANAIGGPTPFTPNPRTVFQFSCEPENVMELLATAHYLHLPPLVDICVRILADYIDCVPSLIGVPTEVVHAVFSLLDPPTLLKVELADCLGVGDSVDTNAMWRASCRARGYELFFGSSDRGMNRLLATPDPSPRGRRKFRPRSDHTRLDWRSLFLVNYLANKMALLHSCANPETDVAKFHHSFAHVAPVLSCLDVPPHMWDICVDLPDSPGPWTMIDSFLPLCSNLQYLALNEIEFTPRIAGLIVSFLRSHPTVTCLALRALSPHSLSLFLDAYSATFGSPEEAEATGALHVLDELDLTGTTLTDAPMVTDLTELVTDVLDPLAVRLFSTLHVVPARLNLRATRVDLNALMQTPLPSLQALTHLYVDDARAKFKTRRGVGSIPSLMSPESWATFASLPNLVEFSVAHNEVSEWATLSLPNEDALEEIVFPASLHTLNLSQTEIREEHGPTLVQCLARTLPNLTYLNLTGSNSYAFSGSRLGFEAFPDLLVTLLNTLPCLVHLNVKGTAVGERAASALVSALPTIGAQTLEILNLSSNHIPLEWIRALIDAAGSHPSLALLSFRNNRSIQASQLPSIAPGRHRVGVYANLYVQEDVQPPPAAAAAETDGSGDGSGDGGADDVQPFNLDDVPDSAFDEDGFWEGPDGYFYYRDSDSPTKLSRTASPSRPGAASPSRPGAAPTGAAPTGDAPRDDHHEYEYEYAYEDNDEDEGRDARDTAPGDGIGDLGNAKRMEAPPAPPRRRLNVVHIVTADEAQDLHTQAKEYGIELEL